MSASKVPVILVMSADHHLLSTMSTTLQEMDYAVSLAENSAQCAEVVSLREPDLLILDVHKTSDDAFALCRQLREQHSFPVLFLIQEAPKTVDAVFTAGGSDYVPKPIHWTVLRHRVQGLLEKRQIERRAEASERRWKQGFEQNHAIKLLIDSTTGMIVDANRAACNFYGYSPDEFRQKRVTDLDATPQARRGGAPGPATLFNFRHKLANGEERDVKMFSGPIDADGRTLIYSIIYDNTKRRQAEAAEHDQRAMAEALRKMTAALSSTLDQNDVLDHILRHIQHVVPNDCANIMLIDAGYAHIVRSRGYEQRNPAFDVNKLEIPIAETTNLRWMIEEGRPLVVDDVRSFPGWVSYEATSWIRSHVSSPIRLGNHVIGFLNLDSSRPYQFTEYDAERLLAFADQAAIAIRNARLYDRVRRQATELEQRVRERTAEVEYERQQLRAILDAMAEGVAYTEYVGDEARVRYTNQALTSMTGYDADEWNQHAMNLFREAEATDEEFQQRIETLSEALVTRGLWHQEIKMRRKDGTLFDMSSVTTRVDGPDGSILGAVTVMRDVSQERALQAQKTRFVAYASHELRTPITNMKTRLYLLRKQPEKIPDHLRVLEEVTDRMQRLVEDLLDISRFERGIIHLKQQMVALEEIVVKSTVLQEPEAERKGLRLTTELPDKPLMVYIDPERVIQVITNLLTNAINYTASGGSVTVRVSQCREDETQFALVEVEDTGIGISQEHLPHIFQAFYRVVSQVEGTGLGLNISKEIVNLHGGEIWVESQPGKGSHFYFSLPTVPLKLPVEQPAPFTQSAGK